MSISSINIELYVYKALNSDTNTTLSEATSYVDERLGLEPGTSLAMVRHFIAIKRWNVDMNVPVNPSKHLNVLSLNSADISNVTFGGLA